MTYPGADESDNLPAVMDKAAEGTIADVIARLDRIENNQLVTYTVTTEVAKTLNAIVAQITTMASKLQNSPMFKMMGGRNG